MDPLDTTQPHLSDDELIEKINSETAPVPWSDLQIVFARGIVIAVSDDLQLNEVAFQISKNNTLQVERWMEEGKLFQVADEKALEWYNNKAELLTTIVKPWVLVQENYTWSPSEDAVS